jgi:hypothetical protein
MSRRHLRPRSPVATLLHFAATLLGLALPCGAQAPQWVRQFGTGQSDIDLITTSGAAPDGTGGVFVCGSTDGNLGGTNAGGADGWIARLDPAGNVLWTTQIGGIREDRLCAAAGDGAGGVYVCGVIGGGNWPSPIFGDAWIARLDGTGKVLWQETVSSTKEDIAWGAAPDGANGVYVCGTTWGDLAGPNAGGGDAWVARVDPAGAVLWSQQFGTSSGEAARAVALDESGGLFVCGSTKGDLGGPNPWPGLDDVWLAHMDESGALGWLRQYGSTMQDHGLALCASPGGVFIAGQTDGAFAGPHQGTFDAWVAHMDRSGARLWSRQFGFHGPDMARGLSPDGAGGVFVAGGTEGDVGGVTSAGLWHFDSAGDLLGTEAFGSNKKDGAHAAAGDGAGGVYLFGYTYGAMAGSWKGFEDAWVARF